MGSRPSEPRVSAGDRVRLKKLHPCGSTEWVVKSAGITVEIECSGCGRVVALSRNALARRLRST
ncbi:MAG: DUF951 domain-containing protein [Chloroflexi bacterium]|nr:DUF951 domain-containing protein [Chloroflexota bacterium]MCY3937521.1 DUF951 domain-containing protein [Chloroflexota bacterium]